VIQVPLVSVGDEQQTVGFGIFGHEFIERQIGETEGFATPWGKWCGDGRLGRVSAGLLRV
jgi:hypothetical protein